MGIAPKLLVDAIVSGVFLPHYRTFSYPSDPAIILSPFPKAYSPPRKSICPGQRETKQNKTRQNEHVRTRTDRRPNRVAPPLPPPASN